MPKSVPISGIVISPDPAIDGDGSWTYTLLVNLPDRTTPVEIAGIVPHDRKYDTTEWDISSVPPGVSVDGLLYESGDMQWFFNEGRASVECEGAGQPAALEQLSTILRMASGVSGGGFGTGAEAGGGGA